MLRGRYTRFLFICQIVIDQYIIFSYYSAEQGRFEILSLTGSFMPSETGGMRNRSGGMSVSLASPDGRVVGGGVAGLLVAASPVQVNMVNTISFRATQNYIC